MGGFVCSTFRFKYHWTGLMNFGKCGLILISPLSSIWQNTVFLIEAFCKKNAQVPNLS